MTKMFERKIVIIFLPISFNIYVSGAQKKHIKTIHLSTHNICLSWEIRKLIFGYTLLAI